jgi:hypothetical protein
VRGYQLYNINNLKLARFKEIFPAAVKNDRIDACKSLELFQLRDHLSLAKDVLQEIMPTPRENDMLKRLSRRRRALVEKEPPAKSSAGRSSRSVSRSAGHHKRCR